MPAWEWPGARVTRVIDGDTLIARLTRDVGFHGVVAFEQRLRLNRINAKPLKSAQGQAARMLIGDLTSLIEVHITTVKPYKYGDEWMAEVWLPNGTNLSDMLVEEELAVHWDGTGPRPDLVRRVADRP